MTDHAARDDRAIHRVTVAVALLGAALVTWHVLGTLALLAVVYFVLMAGVIYLGASLLGFVVLVALLLPRVSRELRHGD